LNEQYLKKCRVVATGFNDHEQLPHYNDAYQKTNNPGDLSLHTFLWHDYETFGLNPRRDRPAQFAGIRTDSELNVIGEPINIFSKQTPDFVPTLESCLVTGITPQHCMEHGMPEFAFAARVAAELGARATVGTGYNTIRFDDEMTRFMFWRNMIDPYGREWQNSCGRWDLIDVVRVAYALRPDGIVWPTNEDGKPSFRLEDLARANGLHHAAAHDALSDVEVTIDMARLIRNNHLKLFEACFALHKKNRTAEEIGLARRRPFLHISGMNPAERGYMAIMMPLAIHPTNNNEVICWDLSKDPSELLEADGAALRARLFKKRADFAEGEERVPLKAIATNKSPMVFGSFMGLLTPEIQVKWSLDLGAAESHCKKLSEICERINLNQLLKTVFTRDADFTATDPEEDLYGSFIGDGDRRVMEGLLTLPPEALSNQRIAFKDRRLDDILFRYRARNFPETLTPPETRQWNAHIHAKIVDGQDGHRTIKNLLDDIAAFPGEKTEHFKRMAGALTEYANVLLPKLVVEGETIIAAAEEVEIVATPNVAC
jgi:exodeoxyribonuclease-1